MTDTPARQPGETDYSLANQNAAERQAMTAEITRLTAENASLKAELTDALTDLNTARQDNASFGPEFKRLKAEVERLTAALNVKPLKPRHHPEKLRQLTGEDGYHRGWQEALTALGNARAALNQEPRT